MITRNHYQETLGYYLEVFPIVALLGPRQCGKTTLALEMAQKQAFPFHHFDLEDPEDLEILQNPKMSLKDLTGLIIIDEIQRAPHLFPYLRTHVDKNPDAKFLILGSCSPDLVRFGSESLAGRIGFIELAPFLPPEVPVDDLILTRGGFPRSYLAASDQKAKLWIKQYVSTFLEKDILNMGFNITVDTMRKVWIMLAHYHGNLVNFSEIGNSLGVSDHTIKKYMQILSSAFMIRELPAWYENIKKRQVKNPKIYMRDTGIALYLLSIDTQQIRLHPKIGALWEGFAIEVITRLHQFEHIYFWRTQHGVELDLFTIHESKRLGFEFKWSDVVKVSSSMKSAVEDLQLHKLVVITNGDKRYFIDEKIEVVPLKTYVDDYLKHHKAL